MKAKAKKPVQYTVRDVPADADAALRRRARAEGKSLNSLLREALVREAGLADEPVRHADLDQLAGLWEDDPEFDAALAAQDVVDPSLWR